MPAKDTDARVEAFRQYLTGLGLAPRTIRNYRQHLIRCVSWADESGADLEALTVDEAVGVAAVFPNTSASRRQLRSTLRHYWDMLDVSGPVKAIRVPPAPPQQWKGLEDDEVTRLLAVARPDWPRGGVIYVGIYLGLRREEIATLRWSNFDDGLKWVRIQGKGDRVRHLPVHENLQAKLVNAYWPGEFVFPGRQAGRTVAAGTISLWVREMGVAAGIPKLHPHQLRHTSGGKVNDSLRDIYGAQQWLGHAQPETTQVYSRVTRDRLLDAMGTFDNWDREPLGVEDRQAAGNVIPFRPATGGRG